MKVKCPGRLGPPLAEWWPGAEDVPFVVELRDGGPVVIS